MNEFKNIALKEIHPDPNQPRKFYDEAAMDELIDSVREKGILQPILVRPNQKGYQIVCGERRYKAAMTVMTAFKDRNTIPAMVRELSDDEALELQIIENLQRKDVHPMEEAVAFKSLLDHGKEVHEIALRVGKKDNYIRQRLKLVELHEKWQKLFFHNGLSLTDALRIASFDQKEQLALYNDDIDKEDEKNPSFVYKLSEYDVSKRRGDLHKAPFDLADPTLNVKMGPCTACSFNTAIACLFPEDVQSPRCTNITCFKVKMDNHFKKALTEAKTDPTILFLSKSYNNDKTKICTELRKEGVHVYVEYRDCNVIDAPEKPDWLEWKEDNYDDEESEDWNRKNFQSDVEDYEKQLAEYEKKIGTGKYKKAFVVDGSEDEIGKYTYLELKKQGSSKSSSSSSSTEKKDTSAADIDEEIKRIRDREKRAIELDTEKIHSRMVEAFGKIPAVSELKTPMGSIEKTALVYLLIDCGGYNLDKYLKKVGITKGYSTPAQKLWQQLCGLSEGAIGYLFRNIMLSKYGSSQASFLSGGIMHIMLKSYNEIPHEAFTIEQNEAAEKRKKRVDKRIAELQAKKKELQALKAPAKKDDPVKKSAPKKAAKKSAVS